MAGAQPKPICQGSNPIDIDPGTSSLMRSPSGSGICGVTLKASFTPRPLTIETLVFDEERLTQFFRSVAHAKAVERHVKLQWTPYTESKVLNFIYAVMPWKGQPGTVDVVFAPESIIHQETEKEVDHLWEVFLDKTAEGGKRTTEFLKGQEEIRNYSLKTVSDVLDDAKSITKDVIRETQRGIFNLAVIKTAATLFVKTASTLAKNKPMAGGNSFLGRAFLTPQFVIGTSYDLIITYIDDPHDAVDARLIAVKGKAEEKFEKKIGTSAVKNLAETFQPSTTATSQAEWLPKRLADMEEQLAKRADAELARKFAKSQRKLARAQQEIARNSRTRAVLGGTKYVFLAYDWYKAFLGLAKTVDQAGGTGYDFIDRRLGY